MRVAVIGAGFSGLAALKACLDENVEVVCFERESELGGVWRFTEGGDKGSVCRSTVINTCKEMMAFSDFPIPKDFPMFMHNSKVMDYALSYARHFDLLKHVRFDTNVVNVSKDVEHNRTGKWVLTHELCGKEIVSRKTECFDAVLVCSGHHWKQSYPSFPGMDTFKGIQMHSKSYRDVKAFHDKTVVLIGVGNSGGDIAVDISRYAKKVYLSTRRGAWVASRYVGGYPRDKFYNRRFFSYPIPDWIRRTVAGRDLDKKFDHEAYGLKPQHHGLAQHPTVNDDLPFRILTGLVNVKPDIKELHDHNVTFQDGSCAADVDCIIYCTGFEFGFPFMEDTLKVEKNHLPCYKFMFPLALAEHHSLAVIGFVQPLGAIMPISEMQCRVALKVFTGQNSLPSQDEMMKDVITKENEMHALYYESPRHTIQVNYVTYMDELAALIGCTPSFWHLFFTDPRMWLQWYFGAVIPAQFRLFGPNPWVGARDAILSAEDDTYSACKTRPIPQKPKAVLSVRSAVVMLLLLAFAWMISLYTTAEDSLAAPWAAP